MRLPVVLIALACLLGGCVGAQQLGAVPAHIACKGKATIVGSGSGFAGVNGVLDCGEGFSLDTGPDLAPVAQRP